MLQGLSTNSEPDYFNEHGDPVYAHTHMVHVKETNRNKHLIQFPISTDFKKVRNSQEKCPTVLLKADTSADVNLMNSTTFDRIIRQIYPSTDITHNGSIWKQFCSRSTWKVPCIPEMER